VRAPQKLAANGASISLLAGVAARIKSTVPFPRFPGVRDARSLDDHPDADAGIVDVPGDMPAVDPFAGEGGHAPLKRGPKARVIAQDIGGVSLSRAYRAPVIW
jgi:hypothetical protein